MSQVEPYSHSSGPPFLGPAPEPEPVEAGDRVAAVDLLRGVALLGILVMNIPTFAWPDFPENPLERDPFTGLDRAFWCVQHVVFDTKMMTLFSMLFGAGLVLMSDRAEKRGASLTMLYYRRVLWLMGIGALHGYLVWAGDILFWYGACGLFLYPLRNWWPRALIGLGLAMNLLLAVAGVLFGMSVYYARTTSAEVAAIEAAGDQPGAFEARVAEVWGQLAPEMLERPEKVRLEERRKAVETYRGGYLGIVSTRAPEVLGLQVFGFVLFAFWVCGGRMLIGMGLMRLGVFTGLRSHRFYLMMVILGYAIGLPLVLLDTWLLVQHRFSLISEVLSTVFLNHLGGLAMALGHAGVVMLAFKARLLPWLQHALASVGRMALTNYLTHSIVLSTIFYGYGFGLFDSVDRTHQMMIVLAIWTFQLIASPLWLRFFRYGPAEWAWRSLTYCRPQPIWA
jgi:uncharacterized protein